MKEQYKEVKKKVEAMESVHYRGDPLKERLGKGR